MHSSPHYQKDIQRVTAGKQAGRAAITDTIDPGLENGKLQAPVGHLQVVAVGHDFAGFEPHPVVAGMVQGIGHINFQDTCPYRDCHWLSEVDAVPVSLALRRWTFNSVIANTPFS